MFAADLVARYGGEEFILVLPETEREGACRMAENARLRVLQLAIAHPDAAAPCATISGGLAMLPRGTAMSAHQLLAAADRALFEAKRLGRNRVVAPPDGSPGDAPLPQAGTISDIPDHQKALAGLVLGARCGVGEE